MSETNNTGKLSGTDAVVVGCNLPHGLVMEVGKAGDSNYARYVIAGANADHPNRPDKTRIVAMGGRFALTTIPADFWKKWYDKNKDKAFVRNGSIFVHTSQADAIANGKDVGTVKTGLEGLNPNGDRHTPPGVEVDKKHLEDGRRAVQVAA